MGGWGATMARDGLDAMYSANHGDTFNCPVEICEARYGIDVGYKRLNETAEGDGRHAGGKGLSLSYRPRGRAVLSAGYSRNRRPVWGLAGGLDGGTNGLAVARANGVREAYAFVSGLIVEPGDEILIGTANGGGWGKLLSPTRLFLLEADARQSHPRLFERPGLLEDRGELGRQVVRQRLLRGDAVGDAEHAVIEFGARRRFRRPRLMHDADHGDVGAIVLDRLMECDLCLRVERAGRFVEEQQSRLLQQDAGDHELLLLAAGKNLVPGFSFAALRRRDAR